MVYLWELRRKFNMNRLLADAQALARGGNFAAAAELCRKSIARGDDVALAQRILASCLHDLGVALWLDGQEDAAEQQFRAAVAADPRHADALNNLGAILQMARRHDEAVALYRQALQSDPANVRVLENLAKVLQHVGRLDEASGALRKLAELTAPNGAAYLIREALLIPKVAPDAQYPARIREALPAKLSAIEASGARMPLPLAFPSTYFPLSYHGIGNKALLQQLARLHLKVAPSLDWTAPHVRGWAPPEGRVKIGFASRFFRGHSIGNTTRGLVEQLERSSHEVFLIRLGALEPDAMAAQMDRSADRVVTLPYGDLHKAREMVGALGLDILFYQDIGLEPLSYFLAFSRLAPVQCTSFGHPDTTGIANMDYFISSANYEVDGAEADYSERLILIPDAGTLSYYYRPPPPAARGRESFGFAATDRIYLCPQALYKIHPAMDPLFRAILARDAHAKIVLIDPRDEELRPALERRLAMDRVVFIDSLPYQDFLALIACCDVMLDTLHFNGQNTNLEAFAMGVPVVTLPGRLQRERHTYGMYRAMGFIELVASNADEYVQLALKVAGDAGYRRQCSARIAESCGVLFENRDFVRNCAAAFRRMLIA
jgi:predicted O-linked N-acetylglucosamine transferase (SPINDLY family)